MNLHERMVNHGHIMFYWRSYLPLLLLGPFIMAIRESAQINGVIGETFQHYWVLFCFIVSIIGLLIRCGTIGFIPAGTSGRNTKTQRAEVLNTSGLYSIVRNPLYLGNYIIILGFLLSLKVWWLVIIGSFCFFIYMERIILAEEKFLRDKFGSDYEIWCSKTPVIIPNIKLWQNPTLSFSLRNVLKREYPGLLAIATAFFLSEVLIDLIFEGENLNDWLKEDFLWIIMFFGILLLSLILRTLKKNTNFLKVEGR